MGVNVFSRKVLVGDTTFTSPTGDGITIFHGHLSLLFATQRQYLHFSVMSGPGNQTWASHSAVNWPTDWTNLAIAEVLQLLNVFYVHGVELCGVSQTIPAFNFLFSPFSTACTGSWSFAKSFVSLTFITWLQSTRNHLNIHLYCKLLDLLQNTSHWH